MVLNLETISTNITSFCGSNLTCRRNTGGILLKRRFRFSRSGMGLLLPGSLDKQVPPVWAALREANPPSEQRLSPAEGRAPRGGRGEAGARRLRRLPRTACALGRIAPCPALLPAGAVSLDPGTARWSPGLPDDRKPARLTQDKQDLPHSSLRPQGVPAARGSPGCPSGRHPRPGASGEAVGVAGEEAGSEGAGPELRPRRPGLEGLAPAAPGAHLPDSAPPRSGTPPSPPASGQTPLLGGLGNRFQLD